MSNDTLLVVATSGRMLAQSARRAGLQPLVIDLFADQDTRKLAAEVRALRHLGPGQISPVIDYFINRFGVRDVVYGSGIETCPESLELLNNKLNIKGNTLERLRPLLDKKKFFYCLAELGIHYPEVSFNPVKNGNGWLIKPFKGEGGSGIEHQEDADRTGLDLQFREISRHSYWQRYIQGVPMSALFLANGEKAQIVGFNRQWTRKGSFLFSGVMSRAFLPLEQQEIVRGWLEVVVPLFVLKGLNSLDFIWDGSRCWLLEINPRPSASMMLYDDRFSRGLLFEHINTCNGRSFNSGQITYDIKAFQILYSERERRIPAGMQWPDWSLDRPAEGTLIRKDRPICSMIASGRSPREVCNQLQTRQQILINTLKGSK